MPMELQTYPTFLQFQEDAQQALPKLQELLKIVETELSHAPPGSLSITRQGNRTWYYHRNSAPDAKPIYLGEGYQFLRHCLAQKKYDLRLRQALLQQIKQLKKGCAAQFPNLAKVYTDFPPAWQELIEPHFLPDDQYAALWLKDYQASESGDPFKSKSEYILDTIYDKCSIFHVYEPRLYLKGYGTVRPDFVALNLRTRQTFYHEHFGKMDSPDYCQKALAKLEDYHRNGYWEGKNLIVTMESDLHPMNPEEVELLFRELLL